MAYKDSVAVFYIFAYHASIIVTLMVNLIFLYKIVQAAGGLISLLPGPRGRRLQTLVSLAVGDIIVAVYSLLFQAYPSVMTIKSHYISVVYYRRIMPFVYGMGIVVLAVECMRFRRRAAAQNATDRGTCFNVVMSLVFGAVPWMLGLLVPLPLTVANLDAVIDHRTYFSLDRQRATVWVCQIVPVILAMIAALVNWHESRVTPVPSLYPGLTAESMVTQNKMAPTAASLHNTTVPIQDYSANQQTYQGASQLLPPPYSETKGEPSNIAPTTVTSSPGSVTFSPAAGVSSTHASSSLSVHYSPREVAALLVITVLYIVCTLPDAVFTLEIVLGGNTTGDLFTLAAVQDVFRWLIIVRSWLLPVVWLASGSLVQVNITPA